MGAYDSDPDDPWPELLDPQARMLERPLIPGMGRLEVIAGSMFSGKTEELIRRVKRALFARQRIQAFKPRIDDRYDRTRIVSHGAGYSMKKVSDVWGTRSMVYRLCSWVIRPLPDSSPGSPGGSPGPGP